jgi:hypothetical protein
LSSIYQELANRIKDEIDDLDRIVNRVLFAWPEAQKSLSDQNVYLDSVALNLHSFYSGLERIFELIARHIDRNLLDTITWHRDLLFQMNQEVNELRPAVVSHDHTQELDKYRRFRHLVRNVYTINLQPLKIKELVEDLPELWTGIRAELYAFADFLIHLDQANYE